MGESLEGGRGSWFGKEGGGRVGRGGGLEETGDWKKRGVWKRVEGCYDVGEWLHRKKRGKCGEMRCWRRGEVGVWKGET